MPSTVFDHPIFPGAKTIKKTITVTNTSGAYSETITDDRISAGMQVNKMYIEDPSVFRSDISVQTLGGSFVFSCSDVVGMTDVTLEFLKIADDPNGITSTEFNILNNKIDDITPNIPKSKTETKTTSSYGECLISGVSHIVSVNSSSINVIGLPYNGNKIKFINMTDLSAYADKSITFTILYI